MESMLCHVRFIVTLWVFGVTRACWISTANPVCGTDRRGWCYHVQKAGVTLTVWNWLKSSWDQNIHKLQSPSYAGSPAHCGAQSPQELLLISQPERRYGASLSSESRASFYDNLTFMLIWTLRKQLFVLDWSCSSCKISPITWGTKGKELRSSKVMMTEQIVGLCSCFPHIFRLLQSQFKWKSEHVATALCVERKLLCSWWCFQEWGESVPLCLQWVLWECHGLGQGTATELYFCVLVLPHAAFILPHPGHRDITGREVLSRLMWVFEINCFSSVHLTPWITLGLEIFYPVIIFSRKTVLIHQKKLTLL